MGVIGGAPAIVSAWIGGLSYSQPLSVLFLAIGAGAVFAGVTAGMLLLYVTGLLIK